MKILINGQPFEATSYDDDTTIIERFVLTKAAASPSFFRIVDGETFTLEEGVELEIRDVRDTIREADDDQIEDVSFVEEILSYYPNLKRKDLGVLWLTERRSTHKVYGLAAVKGLDRFAFISQAKAEQSITELKADIQKVRERIKAKVSKEKKIVSTLDDTRSVGTEPFVLEEIVNQLIVKLPNQENLLDIFDALDASQDLPFILLEYKKRRYYKVFKHIPPLDAWVNFDPPKQGLYFKVLNAPASKLSSKRFSLDNLYSNGVWSIDNRIKIDFKVREDVTQDEIQDKLLDSLLGRIDYEVAASRQAGIKGTFQIPDFTFNKYVFADLMFTDPSFRYFLFANEENASITSKKQFYIYYAPDQHGDISESLSLTITSHIEEKIPSATVRILYATNHQQASAVQLIIGKLLTIYKDKFDSVVKVYTELVPNFQNLALISTKKEKKEDRKTGKRAQALSKFRPEMFGEGTRYPDQCQMHAQPYVIQSEEEARKIIQRLGGDPNKVMFFEGAWYACGPREPKDKSMKFVWPGLKANTSKFDKEYIARHPYLPCCYELDQFTKKGSKLVKYLSQTEHEQSAKRREGGMGHIMSSGKLLPSGRYGDLPFNWEKLVRYLGIEKITKSRQTFYPILRYAPLRRPDSFIHCLERAFNPAYPSFTTEEAKEAVMEVRNKWSLLNLAIAKQELYDFSDRETVGVLLDPNQYIPPENFISLAQMYYDCNIFLYIVDKLHPNGDIVIPRHSQAYLTRDIAEWKKSVLIIKYETDVEEYPYQCEIICQVDVGETGKIKGVSFVFENSPIVEMAIRLFYDSDNVFIVSPEGVESYIPVPEGIV